MASVNDLILAEVTEIRKEVKNLAVDVGILKSDKADAGSKPARLAAYASVVACIVSAISIITACGVIDAKTKRKISNAHPLIDRGEFNNSMRRKVRPVKEPVSSRRDEYSDSPTASE